MNSFIDSNKKFDNVNHDIGHKGNDIVILKKVKSIRQLKNSEKEWVRLCYKEAFLKGYTVVNDIQCYIASKTKIWIERSGIEYLNKSEEEENKKWYFNLAKDHFAYVGVYRKAIDELEQCKKELWSMMAEPETTNSEKVQMLRELHNLSKTCTLLLRDLPFIANLTKYYDMNFFIENNKEDSKKSLSNDTDFGSDEELIEQKVSERLRKMIDESALFSSEQKRKMGISSPPPTDGDMKIDDHIMVEMQKQLNCNLQDVLESINNKDYQESIRRLKEIRED